MIFVGYFRINWAFSSPFFCVFSVILVGQIPTKLAFSVASISNIFTFLCFFLEPDLAFEGSCVFVHVNEAFFLTLFLLQVSIGGIAVTGKLESMTKCIGLLPHISVISGNFNLVPLII